MGNQIKDYYKRLGLSIYATTDEIKKAYRRLSMEFHPDKGNDPDAEVFKSVSKAYEVLKDTEKRESYKRLMRNRFTDTELKKLNNYLEQPENVGIIFHHDKNMNKRIFLVSRKVIAEAVGIDPDRIDWAIDKHNYQQNRNGKGYFTPFAFSPEKMLNGMNGVLETADVLRTDN
ncbi:MAG: DnaJ domain-containing protein [Candidatus Omnitrophica bacterium]|nr:DnaJ domain-containing protein [Candidatus Omnitrophota bacterium]